MRNGDIKAQSAPFFTLKRASTAVIALKTGPFFTLKRALGSIFALKSARRYWPKKAESGVFSVKTGPDLGLKMALGAVFEAVGGCRLARLGAGTDVGFGLRTAKGWFLGVLGSPTTRP